MQVTYCKCSPIWFNPQHVWERKNGEIWIWSHISVPMHGYNPFLAGKWHKSSPRHTQRTPYPFFLVQECFICSFLLPWTSKSPKMMRFVLGTKFGWEWWVCRPWGSSSSLYIHAHLVVGLLLINLSRKLMFPPDSTRMLHASIAGERQTRIIVHDETSCKCSNMC
jgi:hypothetical protein